MEANKFITYVKNLCAIENLVLYEPKYRDIYCQQLVNENILLPLNPVLRPNSYLARSSLDDVARLEASTYVCTKTKDNIENWENTNVMKGKLIPLFDKCMKNKEAYLIAFVLGDIDDEYSLFGLMITDSLYTAINMGIICQCGFDVFLKISTKNTFIKCLHSVGKNPIVSVFRGLQWVSSQIKYICNFPEENLVMSYGSGYGGNSILSKKCCALRMASYYGWKEGWYAEHMMLISLTNKIDNRTIYIAGSFPSSCGKTNMALLKSYDKDWEIKTLGDDITWFRVINNKLCGMNPETGFFGVAPNTSIKTNPVCMETISKNTLFTNVGLTSNNDVYWEGMNVEEEVDEIIPWNDHNTNSKAHPNSRFTVDISQCPQWDKNNDKKWVPISAIIFGGRRSTSCMPLIRRALDFKHGVLMGATLSSEMTAAAEGVVGTLRYDPFAMGPFVGYAWRDYFEHWLNLENKLEKSPQFYYINLFAKINNKFVWEGFSRNIELLKWIYHCEYDNEIELIKTMHGYFPDDEDINSMANMSNLFWLNQYQKDKEYLEAKKSPQILIDMLDEKINNL